MKKGILKTTIIAATMMTMVTPVFATTPTSPAVTDLTTNYSSEIDIKATTSGGDTYSVDVEWGNMSFTYEVGGWDTTKHEYTTEESATWQPSVVNAEADAIEAGTGYTLGSGQILVRNHSNQPIVTGYSVTSSKPTGFSDVTAAVSKASGEIEACGVLHTEGNANVPYETAEVTLSGKPTCRAQETVGTLTISISRKSN